MYASPRTNNQDRTWFDKPYYNINIFFKKKKKNFLKKKKKKFVEIITELKS